MCVENKVDSKSREAYLQVPKSKPQFIYQATFIPESKNIKKIVLKHWHIFQNGLYLQETFVTFKRGGNIMDRVVGACQHFEVSNS